MLSKYRLLIDFVNKMDFSKWNACQGVCSRTLHGYVDNNMIGETVASSNIILKKNILIFDIFLWSS